MKRFLSYPSENISFDDFTRKHEIPLVLPGLLDHDEMCISEYYEPNEAHALKRLVWQADCSNIQ